MTQEFYKLAKNDARNFTNWPKMMQEFYKLAKNDERF